MDARPMTDIFPTTNATWLATQLAESPDAAREHVMQRYFEPLCAYARASSLRLLGEPAELVSDFLASRLAVASYLERWSASGLPLRRWLANGLLTHARNRAVTEARRRARSSGVGPEALEQLGQLAPSHETDALLALERAWAVRTVTEAHERVHSELDAEGRGAWWDLFRLHGMQGMSYAEACRITGIAPSNATNVHRAVVGRLRAALGAILLREGIRAEDIDRELALMQDFLG